MPQGPVWYRASVRNSAPLFFIVDGKSALTPKEIGRIAHERVAGVTVHAVREPLNPLPLGRDVDGVQLYYEGTL